MAKTREQLGSEGDGGVNITMGEASGSFTAATYNSETDTITIDPGGYAAALRQDFSAGSIVGHELGHRYGRAFRDEQTRLEREYIPIKWEYILRATPGIAGTMSPDHRGYSRRRLGAYCATLGGMVAPTCYRQADVLARDGL